MGFQKANDYIEVNERIVEFREKYPNGSLQPVDPTKPYEFFPADNPTMVIYAAAAYRTPDDPRPGIGVVSEPYPGKTPYTKGSELANAETSAWGRAMVAALAVDAKRGIASASEVLARQADSEAESTPKRGRKPKDEDAGDDGAVGWALAATKKALKDNQVPAPAVKELIAGFDNPKWVGLSDVDTVEGLNEIKAWAEGYQEARRKLAESEDPWGSPPEGDGDA